MKEFFSIMNEERKREFVTLLYSLQSVINVTNLLYPKTPNPFFVYLKSCYISLLRSKRTHFLKCVPVPDDVFLRLIPEVFKCSHNHHFIDHCVILNLGYLKKFHMLPEKCSFIGVTSKHVSDDREQPNESTVPVRFVKTIASKYISSQEVLLSETMFCNLKGFFRIPSTNELAFKMHNLHESKDVKLKYASKIVVALIHRSHEVHQDLVKDCLTNYFVKPHLLCTGDLFGINVSCYVPEACYTTGLESLNHLFFKVHELEGPLYDNIPNASKCLGYLVAKNETTLMQVNIQSYIPSSINFCNTNQQDIFLNNFRTKLLPRCPPCLEKMSDMLIRCYKPFIVKPKVCGSHTVKPVFWLVGPSGSGKHCLLNSLAAYFGVHLWDFNCDEIFGKVSGQIEGKLKAWFTKARTATPCILVLSDIQLLCKNAEGQEDLRVISLLNDLLTDESDLPVLVVATSNSENSVTPSMARIFLQTFVVPNLSEKDRKMQLSWFTRSRGANISDDCLNLVSSRCSGFVYSDLGALVDHAVRNKRKRDKTMNKPDKHLSWKDFEEALDKMQSAYSDAIGAPKIPSVYWDDVGGLTAVKDEILRTINTPLHHPELVTAGLRRSGVLLYGPPGTGKTLIAKAVATECSLNFLSVKGPELLNMYVGQSEENVREVFERARAASPCIVFFDELDSLAPNRGKSGDSGGVMDRVVSQLLAEMDGLQKSTHLFVIGATNRPDLIDPALLRPGRFDKLLYVSACEDHESITCVMRALTRKFNLGHDVDIENLTKKIPTHVTGADIYAVCSNAWRNAVRRALGDLSSGLKSEVSNVEVNEVDFLRAISDMTPSVSSDDMKYFKNLQQELSGSKNYVLMN